MQKNILITGKPKSGKSTLLRKLIAEIPNKVGFVTNEVLAKNGRVGFEMEIHTGHKVTLAHIDFKTAHQVSKYFVDIENLESLVPEVSNFDSKNFLYLDEIGQMQLFSEKFKDLTLAYLDSSNTCIATVSYVYEDNFTNDIKKREDVILVELSAESREAKKLFVSQLIKKIEKAKKYISEPERFTVQGSLAELRSEHGTRRLVHVGDKWQCNCDFCKQYGICSHAIAVKELAKK